MEMLYSFRERLRALYAEYTVYLDILGKFVLAFVCLYWIGQAFGGKGVLANLFVVVFVSLILSLFPVRAITIVSAIFITAQAFFIGPDAAILAAAVLLALFFLFLAYVPDDSAALIFTPMAMSFGIPVIVPIFCGLKRRPVSLLAVASGAVTWHLIRVLAGNADMAPVESMSGYLDRLVDLAKQFVGNTNMAADVLALCGALVIVYAVRNLDADYTFEAAIVSGAVIYAAFVFLINTAEGTSFDTVRVIVGAVVSALVMLVVNYFFLAPDYRKSERLVFEDDNYYYYVKAVPKLDHLAEAARTGGAEEADESAEGPTEKGGEA